MRKATRFDSIRRTREKIDNMIVGFGVAFAAVMTGIVVVAVNAVG